MSSEKGRVMTAQEIGEPPSLDGINELLENLGKLQERVGGPEELAAVLGPRIGLRPNKCLEAIGIIRQIPFAAYSIDHLRNPASGELLNPHEIIPDPSSEFDPEAQALRSDLRNLMEEALNS